MNDTSFLLRCARTRRAVELLVITLSLLASGCTDDATGPDDAGLPGGTLYATAMSDHILRLDLERREGTSLAKGWDPVPTPEGTVIYVIENGGIYEGSADGSQSRAIVTGNVQNGAMYDDAFASPQLSPDGRLIAYSGESLYGTGIVVIDRTTGALVTELFGERTGHGYTRPTWTPDGRLVFAGAGDAESGLYLTDASLETFERIDEGLNRPAQPKVSPDGRRIAFSLASHIYTIGIDGTGLQQITTSNDSEQWPTWSPDGKWIAFHAGARINFVQPGSGTAVDLESDISAAFDALPLRWQVKQLEWR